MKRALSCRSLRCSLGEGDCNHKYHAKRAVAFSHRSNHFSYIFIFIKGKLRKSIHSDKHLGVFGAFELVVDDWLGAGLDASDIIAHGVHASLGWVHSDDLLEGLLTTVELVFEVLTVGLALKYDFWLGIFTS